MSAYFNQLELDMIALESAIGAYEVDNGITDDILDMPDSYSYAVESANVNDDFGFGIFDDVAAPATEGVGSAIGGGIKKILSAIAGFFKKVGEGIAAFFNSFKKKKAEVGDKEVKLTPEAAKVANNIRSAIKTAIGIVGNISRQDAEYIKGVIGLINDAIKKSGLTESNVNKSYMESADKKQINKREVGLSDMATSFEKSSVKNPTADTTDADRSAAADEMLTKCEGYLTKVKKTQEELTDAVKKVQEIFQDEVNKLNLSSSKAAEFNTGAPKAAVQHSNDDEDGDLKAYNDRAKTRGGVGFEKATDKKDMLIKEGCIKQWIMGQCRKMHCIVDT